MTVTTDKIPEHQTRGSALPPGVFSPVMLDVHIGRRTAWALLIAFLLLLCIPAVHQFIHDARAGHPAALLADLNAAGHTQAGRLWFPTHESLKEFEDKVAHDSALARSVRQAYQSLLTGTLHSGSETVFLGEDGYLFFRQEIDLSAGAGFLSPQSFALKRSTHAFDAGEDIFTQSVRGLFVTQTARPIRAKNQIPVDPIAAIADYNAQLAARGIHLVLLPVPVKPILYPEKVWPGYPHSAGPAWNVDHAQWLSRLAGQGVDVLDLTDDLWAARQADPATPLYLKTDTHWTPRGLALAADRIAEYIRDRAPTLPRLGPLTTQDATVTAHGDLYTNLFEKAENRHFPPETVTVTRILSAAGDPLSTSDPAARILLLGDSFANIYASDSLAWGTSAGLPQQLMLRLHTPIHTIALNGGGAVQVREALARAPEALAGKKLVLWEFTTRDLGDLSLLWEPVPLPPAASATTAAASAGTLVVIAELLEGPKPVPTNGAYENAVVLLKFRVRSVVAGTYAKPEILATFVALENRRRAPAASYAAGQKFRLTLSPTIAPPQGWTKIDDTQEYSLKEYWALSAEPQ